MNIRQLAEAAGVNARLIGSGDTDILTLCTDSRKVTDGSLFFCIPGMRTDAHDFAPQAVKNGAVALVVERELELDCPQILVPNVREAMSYIASEFYGNPSREMKMVGITGTKGKTTSSFLLKSIFEAAGQKTGLIGTVCCMIGDEELPSGKTTPDPVEFQHLLRQMADAGVKYVVMEVSAHALHMHRIAGVHFEAVGFGNFTQDHLDYFKTMDKYFEAKMMLFTPEYCSRITYNADDERIHAAMRALDRETVSYGIRELADVYAKGIELGETGLTFTLSFHKRSHGEIRLNLSGLFNVYNAMLAASLADLCGIGFDDIRKGLESVKVVPGRVELLDTGTPYRVILDYAHSPDALQNILTTIRQTTSGRLIALFGCGGNRDHEKRPIMGEIGGNLADLCILTSDNPRDEDPFEILKEIEGGIRKAGKEYVVIENRREAIRYALKIAAAGDCVVLAGKGHETYQEIKGVKHPFDEKVVVQELLDEIPD